MMTANCRNHLRRSAGFTLVELLVTIVVLGVLASIAAPAFQNMIQTRRLVAATEAVYAQLQFYRSEAIKSGREDPMNVSISAGTSWCLGMSNLTPNCDCTTANACRYGPDLDASGSADLERNLLGSEFQGISLATSADNVLIDSARGDFSIIEETITLTSASSKTTKIILNKYGRIIICTPSGVGGYPAC